PPAVIRMNMDAVAATTVGDGQALGQVPLDGLDQRVHLSGRPVLGHDFPSLGSRDPSRQLSLSLDQFLGSRPSSSQTWYWNTVFPTREGLPSSFATGSSSPGKVSFSSCKKNWLSLTVTLMSLGLIAGSAFPCAGRLTPITSAIAYTILVPERRSSDMSQPPFPKTVRVFFCVIPPIMLFPLLPFKAILHLISWA